jgi:hypothetical protein
MYLFLPISEPDLNLIEVCATHSWNLSLNSDHGDGQQFHQPPFTSTHLSQKRPRQF